MNPKSSHRKKIEPIGPSCKKTAYSSLIEAQEAIAFLQETKYVKDLSAYRCDMCGMWHLTSK